MCNKRNDDFYDFSSCKRQNRYHWTVTNFCLQLMWSVNCKRRILHVEIQQQWLWWVFFFSESEILHLKDNTVYFILLYYVRTSWLKRWFKTTKCRSGKFYFCQIKSLFKTIIHSCLCCLHKDISGFAHCSHYIIIHKNSLALQRSSFIKITICLKEHVCFTVKFVGYNYLNRGFLGGKAPVPTWKRNK